MSFLLEPNAGAASPLLEAFQPLKRQWCDDVQISPGHFLDPLEFALFFLTKPVASLLLDQLETSSVERLPSFPGMIDFAGRPLHHPITKLYDFVVHVPLH